MKLIIAAAVTTGIMVISGIPAMAFDTLGMSPDQVQQMIQNQQSSDSMMLELIKERNRQQQYSERNPYAGCVSLGEVSGRNVKEAESLGIELGGTNIKFIETTSKFVRANIYRCKQ